MSTGATVRRGLRPKVVVANRRRLRFNIVANMIRATGACCLSLGLATFHKAQRAGCAITSQGHVLFVSAANLIRLTAFYYLCLAAVCGGYYMFHLIQHRDGESARHELPVSPSNHPSVVEHVRMMRITPQPLGITSPADADGDPLTVTVTGLPRGIVRNGAVPVSTGDHLQPQDLPNLTFVPNADVVGPAGSFGYVAEDGRGGRTEGRVNLEVVEVASMADPAPDSAPEAPLWDRIRQAGDVMELDAFLRLYPGSRFAQEARTRRDELARQVHEETLATAGSPPRTEVHETSARPEEPPSPQGEQVGSLQPPASMPPPRDPAEDASSQAVVAPATNATPSGPAASAALPAAPAGTSGEAKVIQDCANCPRLAVIPGGAFLMGQGAADPAAAPAHRVTLRSFALGLYPVTVGEWKTCLAEGGCGFLPRMAEAEEHTPVHNVSWDDAQQFLAWLSRKSGKKYRLPSEAEWEYAARGGTTTRYWWGDEVSVAMANCSDCGGRQDVHRPLPVDALRANPFGLYDMLGGVAEWTADCWFPDYRGAPSDGTAREARACLKRVLRGGSFRAGHDDITVAARGNYDASVRYIVNGFRVARDVN